ncbi:hypothetical protein JCM11251_001137 [Rhodosporidiobolus azoricus]
MATSKALLLATLASLATSVLAADGDVNTAFTSDGERILMGYVPSYGLNAAGLALFFLSTLALWIQWARNKTAPPLKRRSPLYMLCLCISMSCMTLGILLRFVYRQDLPDLGRYIAQYMFVLLSPCGFLANNYILLSRLSRAMGPEAVHSLFLPAHHVGTIFIWSDVITFLLQAAGGGMTAGNDPDRAKVGKTVALAGLSIQLASYILFTCLLLVFGFKCLRTIDKYAHPAQPFRLSEYRFWSSSRVYDWRPLWIVLALSCIGVLIRSAFRIVEYSQGYYGELATGEGYLYGLDMLPLYLSMSAYVFFFPPRFIEGAREINHAPDAAVGYGEGVMGEGEKRSGESV